MLNNFLLLSIHYLILFVIYTKITPTIQSFDNLNINMETAHNVRPDEPQLPVNHDHYNMFGQHDTEFDHEVVAGSEFQAEQFKELDPQEARHRLGKLFDQMDVDNDGKLNRTELKKWIINSFISLDLESSRSRLKEHDENDDDRVTWSEYTSKVYGYSTQDLEYLRKDVGNDSKDFLRTIDEEKFKFDTADLDKDGKLNETEYAAFEHPHNYRHMAPYEILQTLRDFDKDHDGFISEAEYLADDKMHKDAMLIERENFKRYDKNGDGKLDRDEMPYWVTPGFDKTAEEETDHLFHETDKDRDDLLTKQEVVDHHELWVGSQATDYGRHLETFKLRDEL